MLVHSLKFKKELYHQIKKKKSQNTITFFILQQGTHEKVNPNGAPSCRSKDDVFTAQIMYSSKSYLLSTVL